MPPNGLCINVLSATKFNYPASVLPRPVRLRYWLRGAGGGALLMRSGRSQALSPTSSGAPSLHTTPCALARFARSLSPTPLITPACVNLSDNAPDVLIIHKCLMLWMLTI